MKGDFDVISGFFASPAMSPETSPWIILHQKYDLHFLGFPDKLIKAFAAKNVVSVFVEVLPYLLEGINRKKVK